MSILSNFKEIVKKNESDMILTISIILVSLISFGSGLLVDFSKDNQAIIIQNPEINQTSIQQSIQAIDKQIEGKFMGSINSSKYHWPDCPFGKRISEQNQIWFESEKEAQDAGYIRCGSFEKYGP